MQSKPSMLLAVETVVLKNNSKSEKSEGALQSMATKSLLGGLTVNGNLSCQKCGDIEANSLGHSRQWLLSSFRNFHFYGPTSSPATSAEQGQYKVRLGTNHSHTTPQTKQNTGAHAGTYSSTLEPHPNESGERRGEERREERRGEERGPHLILTD